MTLLNELRSILEREVAPLKITFASKSKWFPYLAYGVAMVAAYTLTLTVSVILINFILYP